MWKLKQIFDGEYGCEERQPGEKEKCLVILANEEGEEKTFEANEDWIAANHYGLIRPEDARWLYRQEQGYVESMKNVTVKELAEHRIAEFTGALRKYIL